MKTRCPNCGASFSLDILITHETTRNLLLDIFKLSGALGNALIRYLGLFRSTNRDLSMDRVAKLISELLPDIQAQRIQRNRQVYDAPIQAWVWAIDQAIQARDAGRLTLPLKGHGFLYEVITSYKPTDSMVVESSPMHPSLPKLSSKTATAIAALEQLK